MTGESKTGAVRKAAQERLDRLRLQKPRRKMTVDEVEEWFEDEIWSKLPSDVLGKPISKAQREEILGYGPGGV